MASRAKLSCAMCHHEIIGDPVVLSCSHSLCKDCVGEWWRKKQTNQCPVCIGFSLTSNPPVSLTLKNPCETYLEEPKPRASSSSSSSEELWMEELCMEHLERLKLFCLDHQTLACVVCRDSKTHSGHEFSPVDKAARDHRGRIQESLGPFREKLRLCERLKGTCDQTARHIKAQSRNMEKQIREQFRTLRRLLQEEEEARVTALREEEKKRSKAVREESEALSREMNLLSNTIRETEKELRDEDVSILQRCKQTSSRVQQRHLLDEPRLDPGALMDEAKHLGNLSFNIWIRMKDVVSYSPVTLDPNTAHPGLVLSEDLTSLRHDEPQRLPDNPERFQVDRAVLGSEGFTSGVHSWEVEVRDSTSWSLGVAAESVQRKGGTKAGLWTIRFSNGLYEAVSPLDQQILFHLKTPSRIRARLDWEKGELLFCDADSEAHIFTFTTNFTEKIFPYFSVKKQQLKILPKKITADVK